MPGIRLTRKRQNSLGGSFTLPTRKAKIAANKKKNSQGLFCLCGKTSKAGAFMIQCDYCDAWFHGNCVNISQYEAGFVDKYFCYYCRDNDNPDMVTTFRRRSPEYVASQDTFTKNDSETDQSSIDSLSDESDSQPERRITRSFSTSISNLSTQSQCYGPQCCNSARPDSKYCSDKCGMSLNEKRLRLLVEEPQYEVDTPDSYSDKYNKSVLLEINSKLEHINTELARLDHMHEQIDNILERAAKISIDTKFNKKKSKGKDDSIMDCVSCGLTIPKTSAIKHMENCFVKHELKVCISGNSRANVKGRPFFCDFYDETTKSYCKRLYVLCPEHYEELDAKRTDICGRPLVDDIFQQPTDDLCRAPKRKCQKHCSWEKIHRAEIDLDRIKHWMEYERLQKMEKQVKEQMKERKNLLNQILHETKEE